MLRFSAMVGTTCAVCVAHAATINVTPADDYTKIEGAQAGDTVLIEPGTYKFRVMLTQTGTAANPIVIRAKDPLNRPVWDLNGQAVSQWPGSYTAGDRGRGCWQVKGSHYVIQSIVFRNCQDNSSAGIRAVNSTDLTVRDCLFENNTNGLTGSSDGYLVEFCEFGQNGKLTSGGSPSHNVYIYGGTFTMRYSYLHDPLEGQNFHVRARQSVIEYNWLTRAASYPGDIMSCNYLCGGSGTNPITQQMTLRGNIIVQNTTGNLSQLVALFNDESSGSYDGTGAVSKMELTLINNTVIGTQVGGTQRLVNMRNDGVDTEVTMHNNIVYQVKELAVPYSPSLTNWSVSGQNNWVSSGTPTTGLTGSLTGASPGFADLAGGDYRLASGSPCLNQAASVSGLPTKEYYLDETIKLQYRPRATVTDLGAYEQGNSAAPVGPYGTPPPPPDAGVPTPDSAVSPPDAAVPDTAPPAPDTAPPAPDTAPPAPDAAPPAPDAPAPPPDVGVPPPDAGAPDGPGPAGDGPAATADGPSGTGDVAVVVGDGGGGRKLKGEGGCSCGVGRSGAAPALPAFVLLALAAALRRRRRG